jgi:DNA-binding CsgD family transcriptional regulator
MDQRAHTLIDRIYAAALDSERWQEVVEGISNVFGGAPVTMGFAIPDDRGAGPRFGAGVEEPFRHTYMEHLFRDVPWSTRYHYAFMDHWGGMDEVLGHVDLAATELYTEWLKPQGFSAVWPVGHSLSDAQGEPVGGFGVFRREGEPEFEPSQFEAANALIPHLRRAVEIQITLHGARRERLALAEAIDRLPTGLLLLDSRRRVVIQSKGADRILAAKDGFRVDASGPAADDARENATLQKLIADALDAREGEEIRSAGFGAINRPSGERAYAVMVTPLLAAPGGSVVRDAAVAVFIADPSARVAATPEVLSELYQLTHSEAELVRLLASGLSLEEAAVKRGVSLNTARSHLKHAFAKTDTSRQGELVRLIITGLGQMGG